MMDAPVSRRPAPAPELRGEPVRWTEEQYRAASDAQRIDYARAWAAYREQLEGRRA